MGEGDFVYLTVEESFLICVLIQHMASVLGNMVRYGLKCCSSNTNPHINII